MMLFLNIDSEFCNVTRITKLLLMNIEILNDLRLLLCPPPPQASFRRSFCIDIMLYSKCKSCVNF